MSGHRLVVALTISLFINVFVAGGIAGSLLMLSRQGGIHPQAVLSRRPVIDAGLALLPPDRMRFARLMRQLMRDNPDLIRSALESRKAAADLFTEPTFDAEAVNAALQRARDADFKLRSHVEMEVVAFAASLSADERAILGAGLAQGGPLRHPIRRMAAPN